MNNSTLIKIMKSGGYGLLSKVIVSLSQIIFIPLMIQVYGQEKFGILATILSLNAFVALSNFGISKTMQNKVSCLNYDKDKIEVSYILSESLFIIIKLSLLVITCIALVSTIFLINIPESLFYIQIGASFLLSSFCILLISFFYDFYRGCQNPEKSNKIAMFLSIAIVLLTYIALHFELPMFQFFVLAYCVPQVFLIIFMMFISKESKLITWSRFFKVRKKSVINKTSKLFFALSVIQFFGFGADTAIITTVLGASAAAEYNIVFRFYTLLIFGFSVFSSTIWPFFAKYNSEKKYTLMGDIAKKGVMLSIIYGGGSFLFIIFIAPIIVEDILNVNIISDHTLYYLLGGQAVLVINTSIVIPMLNAMQKLEGQVYLGLLSITVNVILTIIFIKAYGILGAPLATIISHLIFGVIPLNYILFKALRK
jgi:O-antigen/teichoic acid export membrane protein